MECLWTKRGRNGVEVYETVLTNFPKEKWLNSPAAKKAQTQGNSSQRQQSFRLHIPGTDVNNIKNYYHSFFFFWLCCMACGILVPSQGLNPARPSSVKAQSPNPWTTREFSQLVNLTPCTRNPGDAFVSQGLLEIKTIMSFSFSYCLVLKSCPTLLRPHGL